MENIYCECCGNMMDSNSNFCPVCGAQRQVENIAQDNSIYTNYDQNMYMQNMYMQNAPNQNTYTQNIQNPNNNNQYSYNLPTNQYYTPKKPFPVIPVLICIIVILIIGLVVVITQRDSNDKNKEHEPYGTSSYLPQDDYDYNDSYNDTYNDNTNIDNNSTPTPETTATYTSNNGLYSCEAGWAVVERNGQTYKGTTSYNIDYFREMDCENLYIKNFYGDEYFNFSFYYNYLTSGASFDRSDFMNEVSGAMLLIDACPLPSGYYNSFVSTYDTGNVNGSNYITNLYACIEQYDPNGVITIYFEATVSNDTGETTYKGFAAIDTQATTSSNNSSYDSSYDNSYSNDTTTYQAPTITETCAVCYGSGMCSICDGSGIASYTIGHQQTSCGSCFGNGLCTYCHGTGVVSY